MGACSLVGNTKEVSSLLEWHVALRPIAGEIACGDAYLVKLGKHQVVVGVVDGLGHGPEAAIAAATAIATIRQYADESLIDIVHRCHESLRRTRGVVLSLVAFSLETESLSWVGVGNVDALLFRVKENQKSANEALLVRGGVVGYRMPPLRVEVLPIIAGDMLVLATDGIRSAFCEKSPLGLSSRMAAENILRNYARASDDALALVVRYRGLAHE
jgi:serine phosphatase RsbU (regulator of sigma subunit)